MVQTQTHAIFSYFGETLYTLKPSQNSNILRLRKTLFPSFVEKHLTPRGLAYWFMDDGGKSFYGQGLRA